MIQFLSYLALTIVIIDVSSKIASSKRYNLSTFVHGAMVVNIQSTQGSSRKVQSCACLSSSWAAFLTDFGVCLPSLLSNSLVVGDLSIDLNPDNELDCCALEYLRIMNTNGFFQHNKYLKLDLVTQK